MDHKCKAESLSRVTPAGVILLENRRGTSETRARQAGTQRRFESNIETLSTKTTISGGGLGRKPPIRWLLVALRVSCCRRGIIDTELGHARRP